MEPLIIAGTESTPSVKLDAESGSFEFTGRSVPDDAEEFFHSTLEWIEEYARAPKDVTYVAFDLEFFNIASSKRILFVLYKLNELIDAGKDVQVKWHYTENDHDMLEVGQDYAFMVKVPFEFIRMKKKVAEPV